MNKLTASNIVKSYQSGDHQTEVLSNISISISEGDLIGVIGSSGSGKQPSCKFLLDWKRLIMAIFYLTTSIYHPTMLKILI